MHKNFLGYFLAFSMPVVHIGCGQSEEKQAVNEVNSKEESFKETKEPDEIKVDIILKDERVKEKKVEEAPLVEKPVSMPQKPKKEVPKECLNKAMAKAPTCAEFYGPGGDLLVDPLFDGAPLPGFAVDPVVAAPWPIPDFLVEEEWDDDDYRYDDDHHHDHHKKHKHHDDKKYDCDKCNKNHEHDKTKKKSK